MNWFRNLSLAALFILIFPVFLLLFEGFGPMFSVQGYRGMVLASIGLTILSSAIAALVSFLLFTPLAYYFARSTNIVALANWSPLTLVISKILFHSSTV